MHAVLAFIMAAAGAAAEDVALGSVEAELRALHAKYAVGQVVPVQDSSVAMRFTISSDPQNSTLRRISVIMRRHGSENNPGDGEVVLQIGVPGQSWGAQRYLASSTDWQAVVQAVASLEAAMGALTPIE